VTVQLKDMFGEDKLSRFWLLVEND